MAKPNKRPEMRFRVPGWGRDFLAPGEYADFTRIVTEALRRQGGPVQLDLQAGCATLPHARGRGRLSLANLARLCKAHRKADWPAVVAEFLASMRQVHEDPAGLVRALERFEDARGRLKVRMQPDSYLKLEGAASLMLRRVTEGIAKLLVCDLGFANISVPADVARGWGLSEDEIWATATENVRAEGRLPETRGEIVGVPVDLLASPSNYAATHVLFFGDYLPEGAGYGALVGVPQRHVLVRHIIRDESVLAAVSMMTRVIDDWYEQGPGEISRDLYWWRGGKLTALPIVRMPDRVALVVGGEFGREVLERVLGGS